MVQTRSKSHSKFMRTSDRAMKMVLRHYKLLKAHVEDQEVEEWDETHDDLFRAAIVLSVSGMDSYFTDRFVEGLTPYLKQFAPSKELLKILEDAGFNTCTALEMLRADRPSRRLSNMVRRSLAYYTTQDLKYVDKLFLAYGFRFITSSAEKLVRRKTLARSVKSLVTRRHKIAHHGDYNGHGKLNPVNYAAVIKQMRDLKLLVGAVDDLLVKKKI